MTRAADLAKLIAGGGSITVDDNSTNITLKSTDADSNLGPILDLLRDGGSPADSDFIGQVRFQAKDDGGNIHEYAKIFGQIADVTGGTEDGILNIRTVLGGTDTRRIDLGVTETVFNEDSADLDFRVESDANTHGLFLEGSSGNLIVGDSSSAYKFKVKGTGDLVQFLSTNAGAGGAQLDLKHESASPADGDSVGIINFAGFDSGSSNAQYANVTGKALDVSAEEGALDIGVRESSSTYTHTKIRVDKDGLKFNGDTATANALDDYEEGTYTATLSPGTSGSITVDSSYNTLSYTKIGRQITVTGRIRLSAASSPVGFSANLSLPFVNNASSSQEAGRTIGLVSVAYAAQAINAYGIHPTSTGVSYVNIVQIDDSNFPTNSAQDFSGDEHIGVMITYSTG